MNKVKTRVITENMNLNIYDTSLSRRVLEDPDYSAMVKRINVSEQLSSSSFDWEQAMFGDVNLEQFSFIYPL